jgi:hypothetical protein
LLAKGKNKRVVMTAVGREWLGFIWAIGIKAETAQKGLLQRAAYSELVLKPRSSKEAARVVVEGYTERRILESSMR